MIFLQTSERWNKQEGGEIKAVSEDDSSDEEELPPQKIVTNKKKLKSNHKEKNKGQKQAAAPKKAQPTLPHTTTKKTRGYNDHDDPFCVGHSRFQQKVQT